MHKSFRLVLIFLIFQTFSVKNTFSQLIFVCSKCLVLIKACSRIIVDLKKNILHTNNELFEHNTYFLALSRAATWIHNILFLLNTKCTIKALRLYFITPFE